jgi:hypothetical protein
MNLVREGLMLAARSESRVFRHPGQVEAQAFQHVRRPSPIDAAVTAEMTALVEA